MRIILKNTIFLLLSACVIEGAYAYSRDIAEFSGGVNGVGLGGTSGYFPGDGGLMNPARLGDVQRMGATLGAYLSPQFEGMYGAFYLPSSFGTIVINPSYIQNSMEGLPDYNRGSLFTLRLGYGRQLTERFSFGLFALPSYGSSASGSFFGMGVEPALNYNTRSNIDFGSGFGIYNFSFFTMARNLSVNLGEDNIAPRPSLRYGMQVDWYRQDKLKSYFLLEGLGIGKFDSMPVHLGAGVSWWFLNLNAGYMFSNESELFRGFSLGAGLNIELDDGVIKADYAFLPSNDVRKEGYHFVSVSGYWGLIDRDPPVVTGSVTPVYFSPNHDGVKDYTFFRIEVQDSSAIMSWKLSIKDASGREVRHFEHDDREVQRSFGVKEFFKTAFYRRESLVVPPSIRWDGTANRLAIESGGLAAQSSLPDGVYTYSFVVTDIHGNTSKPWSGNVLLDTAAPQARLSLEHELFSPNGDGNLDTLLIMQETFGNSEDTWQGTIRDQKGEAVVRYSWDRAPGSFYWDGNLGDGSPAAEGLYTYELTGKDYAGNESTTKTRPFTLSRRVDRIDLILSAEGLSPNNDGQFDTITLRPELQNTSGLETWEILITSKSPSEDSPRSGLVKEFSGIGRESLPTSIVWDGKAGNGALQKDGVYYVAFRTLYSNGNAPASFPKPILIDTVAPLAGVEADLRIFTPDGDGNAEEQVFRLDIRDSSAIANWELVVYEVQYDEQSKRTRLPFKRFSGKENWPSKIFWDGKSDSGRLVESATVHDYILTAIDQFGNRGESSVARFETGILVLPTARGLQIRLSSIEFDLGKTTLKKEAYGVLEKLAGVLRRYPNYEIKVEGHTDDIGDDDINLKISEQRALTVMNYLIDKEGIEKERITYEGRGEVFPLLPNDSWYNRSRNRRVEFILLK